MQVDAWRNHSIASPELERDDLQSWDLLEVLRIESRYIEAQVTWCGSNEQILKPNYVAKSGLFALNLSGELGYFKRKRVNDQIARDLIKKSSGGAAGLRQFWRDAGHVLTQQC